MNPIIFAVICYATAIFWFIFTHDWANRLFAILVFLIGVRNMREGLKEKKRKVNKTYNDDTPVYAESAEKDNEKKLGKNDG